MSICPYSGLHEKNSHNNNNGSNNNNHIDEQPVKRIPKKCFDFGICNLFQFKSRGQMFLRDRMRQHRSTVYKIKFNESRIMLCDHVAVASIFDSTKVLKEPSFGFVKFDTRLTKSYVPCIFQNSDHHERLKSFLLDFIDDIKQNLDVRNIVELVRIEFERIEHYSYSGSGNENKDVFDVESVLRNAVANVVMSTILDEYPSEPMLVFKWLGGVLGTKLKLLLNPGDDQIAERLLTMIRNTKKIEDLKNYSTSGISYEDKVIQIMFMTVFNAIGGISVIIISCLAAIIRLNENDRILMKREAGRFFNCDNYEDTLPKCNLLHSFYLEVLRMHPPVPNIYARAVKNFKLNSTSGTFNIKQDDLLCASVVLTQRDSTIFENPDQFVINRPIELLEKHNIVYGGFFKTQSTASSHKCPGNELSGLIIKTFIAFLLRCDIVPAEYPIHTYTNVRRQEASDEPLKLNLFHYEV